MMLWNPLVWRELKEQARKPTLYNLRVAGALILAALMGVFILNWNGPLLTIGGPLFGFLNSMLFLANWVIVPLLVCDSISREKREGTLGLLFLTPLTAFNIVTAKCFVGTVRILMLALGAMPILVIPIFMGGVGGPDLLRMALLHSGGFLFALTAGILASSLTERRNRAILLAFSLSTLSSLMFLALYGIIRTSLWMMQSKSPLNWEEGVRAWHWYFQYRIMRAVGQIFGSQSFTGFLGMGSNWKGVETSLWFFLLSLVLVLGVMVFATRCIRVYWKESGSVPGKLSGVSRVLATPIVGRKLLASYLRWLMNLNPMLWLEGRHWSGRLSKWGWVMVVACWEILLLTSQSFRQLYHAQWNILMVLSLGISFHAAGSFHREKESGGLELILVTPIREWEFLFGRWMGMWLGFLPALGLIAVTLNYAFIPYSHGLLNVQIFSLLALIFGMGIPIIGTYFALVCQSQFSAWLQTLGRVMGGVLIWDFLLPVNALGPESSQVLRMLGPAIWVLGLSAYFGFTSLHVLKSRQFVTS